MSLLPQPPTTSHQPPTTASGPKGLALLEVLIATTIFVIVLFAIYLIYETNQKTYARGEEKADLQQNARIAMETLVRELRMAGDDPSGTAQYPLVEIDTTDYASITFIADIDQNGVSDKVKYTRELDGGTGLYNLYREVWKWDVATSNWATTSTKASLAEKLTTLTFRFSNASDASTTNRLDVRRIGITMTFTGKDTSGETHTYTLQADVRPRIL